jgi:hypothetical protein
MLILVSEDDVDEEEGILLEERFRNMRSTEEGGKPSN